jgi:hypothetical protein
MIVAIASRQIHTMRASGVLARLDDFLSLPEVLYILILFWLISLGRGRYSVDGLIASKSRPLWRRALDVRPRLGASSR